MGFEGKVAIDPHPMGLVLQANNVASLSLIRFKERVSLTLTQEGSVMTHAHARVQQLRDRFVYVFKYTFSVFKQYYTYFYIFFSSIHLFNKIKNYYLNTHTKRIQRSKLFVWRNNCLDSVAVPLLLVPIFLS